ncbi:MAG: hypothetical protein IT443_13210 [Phycisphaeraceae bacterium]|nr:hypothetical protein [Phycisphaeraceae bacterium]
MRQALSEHPRNWEGFKLVYPVISRRAQGLSVGINLNPDKACNFDCVYCCVDRTQPAAPVKVDLHDLRTELDHMLSLVGSGEIWNHPKFAKVDAEYRRLNDIAFSGDGEPTSCPCFAEAVRLAEDLRSRHHLREAKIVIITNATLLERPAVQEGLLALDFQHDELWAKLDAGSDDYYHKVDRTAIPLRRVLDNIAAFGRTNPVVIQSLFMKIHDEPIAAEEFDAYLSRLEELLAKNCQIKLVQLYTVARQVAESYVAPLEDEYLDQLAERFRQRLPHVPAKVFYGL